MKFIKITTAILSATLLFAACKKEKNNIIETPEPAEQELITTVRLVVTSSDGFNKTFDYHVDNGFGNSGGHVHVDDVVLAPNKNYNVEVMVLNESETPAEDVTEEVKEESHHHLFVFESTPASGAGSVTFSNGNKDDEGEPLNQKIDFATGDAGTGSLVVTLKHEPTNKNAVTADAAGGETDAQATFLVKIQ